MAAMEVFGTPEILEAILLRAAYEATLDCVEYYDERRPSRAPPVKKSRHRLEPVATISTLSRVCRNFQHTITGSPELQRLLTGNSGIPSDMVDVPFPLPIMWLLGHTFDVDEVVRYQSVIIDQLKSARDRTKDFLDKYGRHPEASWRRVRVYQGPESCPVELSIQFRRPKGYNGLNGYGEGVEAGCGTTLGDLVDSISLILHRSGSEHVAKVEAVLKGWAWEEATTKRALRRG